MQCRNTSEFFSIAWSGHGFTTPGRRHNGTFQRLHRTYTWIMAWITSKTCLWCTSLTKVESRPQSLEKKGSETGSNLGHSTAKNIWTRSLWLLSLIPAERLQNVRCQEMKLLTLSLRYPSPKLGLSLYRGQTASLRIPCRSAQGLKLHRRTLMPPEFLPSCLHPVPWPSSARSWTELTSPPSLPVKLSLWETKRSTWTTSRSPCFLLTRHPLFQFWTILQERDLLTAALLSGPKPQTVKDGYHLSRRWKERTTQVNVGVRHINTNYCLLPCWHFVISLIEPRGFFPRSC